MFPISPSSESIISLNLNCTTDEVQVAVTDRGRISVITYDLLTDKDDRLYFEYGVMFERVHLDDFEEAA